MKIKLVTWIWIALGLVDVATHKWGDAINSAFIAFLLQTHQDF